MRRTLPVLVCALGALVTGAGIRGVHGQADDDRTGPLRAPADGGVVLLARDAALTVRWADAPALAAQLARVVLGDLDHARGTGARVSVLGDAPAGLPPAGWPLELAGGVRGAGPFGGDCASCTTRLGEVGAGRRVATLWALGRFTLDRGAADLRVLELRLRYQDGVAIWINGVPVVRRGVAADGHPLRLADRPHGSEWEAFFVPVAPGLLRAGDNVVAVEVHAGERSAAPLLDLEVLGRRDSRVVRGPMVQRVTATSAVVVVETDVPTRASLAWGPTAALGRTVTSPLGRRHELALDGLPAGAAVSYQVTVDGVPGAVHRFATAPGPGEVLRVAVYGDVRGGHDVHARLVAAMAGEAPDLVVSSGDLVMRGNDEADWQRFFAVTAPLLATTPYYSVVGNHDVGRAGDLGRRMTELFVFPSPPGERPASAGWYSFDVAGVHFVMLDSNLYEEAAQKAWLEADLAAAKQAGARAIFAFTHDGPYARGIHGGSQVAVKDYVPLLAKAGVTLLFSGHDHIYQRGRHDGLDYIVTGGGGAPLYAISCGVPGRPRCKLKDGMLHAAREHHYLMLTVYPGFVEACAKRPDGSPLEPCVKYPLGGSGGGSGRRK